MGLVYALAAYLSWGLLVPVHFRLLGAYTPNHILAERIVWSSLFAGTLALILAARHRLNLPLPLRRRHALLLLSAAMIGVNWLLYLYAISGGHLLDASLGYYINPLVSVALGRIVLGERLRPMQAVAVGHRDGGRGRRRGLGGRTAPHCRCRWRCRSRSTGSPGRSSRSTRSSASWPRRCSSCRRRSRGSSSRPNPFLPAEPASLALLMLTGLTTALPLIWFAAAAVRLRLTTLGLLQYVAPTCLLGLSVLAFGERVEPHAGRDARPDLGRARPLHARCPARSPRPRFLCGPGRIRTRCVYKEYRTGPPGRMTGRRLADERD